MKIIENIGLFFLIYLALNMILTALMSISAKIKIEKNLHRKRMNYQINYQYFKPVSIVVPLESQEKIDDLLDNITSLDYNQFEIILIGDIAKMDDLMKFIKRNKLMKVTRPYKKVLETKPIERIYEGIYKERTVTLIFKERTVLTDDYNAGVNVAKFPYVLTLNSNQRIQENALKEFILASLEDEKVVMCSGVTRLEPTKKTALNLLEFAKSTKRFIENLCFDSWNGNLILSNSFLFFKKEIFLDCKGFYTQSNIMDSSLFARMHVALKKGKRTYRIRYVWGARAIEKIESSLSEYFKRRKEQKKEFLSVMLHHKKLFLSPRYGLLSLFTYSYYFFFELFKKLVYILGIIALLILTYQQIFSLAKILIIFGSVVVFYLLTYLINSYEKKKIGKGKKEEISHVVIE